MPACDLLLTVRGCKVIVSMYCMREFANDDDFNFEKCLPADTKQLALNYIENQSKMYDRFAVH